MEKHRKLQIDIIDSLCEQDTYLVVFNENNERLYGTQAAMSIRHLDLESLGCSFDVDELSKDDTIFFNTDSYKLLDLIYSMNSEQEICLDKERSLYLGRTVSTNGCNTVFMRTLNTSDINVVFAYKVWV